MKENKDVIERVKEGSAKISIDEITAHYRFGPLDTSWQHAEDGDFRYVVGKQKIESQPLFRGPEFEVCNICGNATVFYVVEEVRVITVGKNEQQYEHIYNRGAVGTYCSTCGFKDRSWHGGGGRFRWDKEK